MQCVLIYICSNQVFATHFKFKSTVLNTNVHFYLMFILFDFNSCSPTLQQTQAQTQAKCVGVYVYLANIRADTSLPETLTAELHCDLPSHRILLPDLLQSFL